MPLQSASDYVRDCLQAVPALRLRVFPGNPPHGAKQPLASYVQTGQDVDYALGGAHVIGALFQVTLLSSRASAEALRGAVLAALRAGAGAAGGRRRLADFGGWDAETLPFEGPNQPTGKYVQSQCVATIRR